MRQSQVENANIQPIDHLEAFKKYPLFWQYVGQFWHKNLLKGKKSHNPFFRWLQTHPRRIEGYIRDTLEEQLKNIKNSERVKRVSGFNRILKRMRNVNDEGEYSGLVSELGLAISFIERGCSYEFEPKLSTRLAKPDSKVEYKGIEFFTQIKRLNRTSQERVIEEEIERLRHEIENNTSGILAVVKSAGLSKIHDISRALGWIQLKVNEYSINAPNRRKTFEYSENSDHIIRLTIEPTGSRISRFVWPTYPTLKYEDGREHSKYIGLLLKSAKRLPVKSRNVIILDIRSDSHEKVDLFNILELKDDIFSRDDFRHVSAVLLCSESLDREGWTDLFLNRIATVKIPSNLELLLRTLRKDAYEVIASA